MIELAGVRKRFGSLRVLRGIDLSVSSGAVTAVVGPNGSGKTTLIKCILGLTRPDEGGITIAGRMTAADPASRELIGYMQQSGSFPDNLTGREVIDLLLRIRGRPDTHDLSLVDDFGFAPELQKPIRALSGGNRQRLSAVVAFLFRPEILILDEPSVGLDPIAGSVLKDRIRRERDVGRTVLLTSHIMSEVEELADRMVFLLDGQIQVDGSIAEIREMTGEMRLERAVAQLMRGRQEVDLAA